MLQSMGLQRVGHDWVTELKWTCTYTPGGGHGNSLQYSCLENPIDRGAWRAAVQWVAESQTWLKQLSTCTHTHTHSDMVEWVGSLYHLTVLQWFYLSTKENLIVVNAQTGEGQCITPNPTRLVWWLNEIIIAKHLRQNLASRKRYNHHHHNHHHHHYYHYNHHYYHYYYTIITILTINYRILVKKGMCPMIE